MPEAQLIALLIVVVKLHYPLDKVERRARTALEPAAFALDWKTWAEARQNLSLSNDLEIPTGQHMKITQDDVFRLSDSQIDDYLAWYDKNFLQVDNGGTFTIHRANTAIQLRDYSFE